MGNTCCQEVQLNYIDLNPTTFEDWKQITPTDPYLIQKYQHLTTLAYTQQPIKKIVVLQNPHLPNRFCLTSKDQNNIISGKTVIYQKDVIQFEGEMNNGEINFGTINFIQAKRRYEGSLKNGKADGQGTLTDQIGYKLKAVWNQSFPQSGTLLVKSIVENTQKYISIMFEQFPFSKVKITYPDESQYQGTINQQYQRNGLGIFKNKSNLQIYEGEWRADKKEGKGVEKWNDNARYEGSFLNNKKNGFGIYNFANGKRFEGQWIDDKQSGPGKFFNSSNELIKEGIWKDGMFISTSQLIVKV